MVLLWAEQSKKHTFGFSIETTIDLQKPGQTYFLFNLFLCVLSVV